MKNKCVCEHCGWNGLEDDLLMAPNPFMTTYNIAGCPECKQVECLRYACDHEGCWNKVSKGEPTDEGYRVTCYQH